MPITKNSGRQEVIQASVDFTFADIPTTATAYAAMDIPQNAVIIGGALTVTTAFNTATTATLNVGDVTLGTRYATAVDLKIAARTALTLTGFVHTNTEKVLNVTPAYVGAAATAGAATLSVQYYVKGRASFSQG